MLWKITITLLTIVAAASLFAGCADNENLPTIRGNLEIQLDEGQTGFDFSSRVPLVSNPENASPGCASGGCTLTYDAEGQPVAFELWLDRGTAGEVGAGFRSFDLSLSDGEVAVVASVEATNGEQSFASAGGANCSVTSLADLDGGGELALEIDCDLVSLEGDEATASAELYLDGCNAIWE